MSPFISGHPPSINQIYSAYYMFLVTSRSPDINFSVLRSFCLTSTRHVPNDPWRAFFLNNKVIDTIHHLHMSHFALISCWYTFFSILWLKIGEGHQFWKPAIYAHTGFLTENQLRCWNSWFIIPFLQHETWIFCFFLVWRVYVACCLAPIYAMPHLWSSHSTIPRYIDSKKPSIIFFCWFTMVSKLSCMLFFSRSRLRLIASSHDK